MKSSIFYFTRATVTGVLGAGYPRSGSNLGTFYGYSANFSGLPLFYSDGKALLGYGTPAGSSVATNVTFTLTDTTMTATAANASSASNWTNTKLYIDPTQGSFEDAGFTTAANTSVTTTGFVLYGTGLFWKGDGNLDSNWYAVPINGTRFYSLAWNTDLVLAHGALPVILKNVASVNISA